MKKQGKCLAMVLCATLVCGCGGKPSADVSETLKESIQTSEVPVEEKEPAEESPSEPEKTGEEQIILGKEEITFFTGFIQDNENYGFLLSEYDKPEDVNLDEVFYNGAGIGESLPLGEESIYLEAAGYEQVETDCIKLTTENIKEFVRRKLGIEFQDMNRSLEWGVYAAETDSYYFEAGDTNYMRFTCSGGVREGNTYTLRFIPESGWNEWAGGDRETVLVKTENGYHFLSNHLLTNEETTETSRETMDGVLPFETPLDLEFSSGAGGWGTDISLRADGLFEGDYHDSDMGDLGDEYPYGTYYICSFSGQFYDIKQINDHTYSMTLGELFSQEIAGTEWIEDGIRYMADEPYGMDGGKEFLLYTPDTPIDELSEEFLSWWPGQWNMDSGDGTLSCYGLYNKEMEYGFFTYQ